MIDLGCLKSLCFTETNSYWTGKLVQELQQPATSDSERATTNNDEKRTYNITVSLSYFIFNYNFKLHTVVAETEVRTTSPSSICSKFSTY